ncbi:MAG TPA: hypothetical protein VFV71_01935 [Burkholderiales bacterium]|nr:hypothetical protein [Burkholderiales bacterium]
MLRKLLPVALLGLAYAGPAFAQAQNVGPDQTGELIWRDATCYFFVVKIDDENYSLFEFLGGPSPMVGSVFEGKLSAFGTRKIDNKTEGKPTMVYSEVFGLPKAKMDKKIPRQCRHKKEFEALPG